MEINLEVISPVTSWVFAGLAVLSFTAWIVLTVYILRVIWLWYKVSSGTDISEEKVIKALQEQSKNIKNIITKLTEVSDKLDMKENVNGD